MLQVIPFSHPPPLSPSTALLPPPSLSLPSMRNESVHSIVHTITVTEFQSVTQMAILALLGKCICSYVRAAVAAEYSPALSVMAL